jgi:hypothetical protein
MVKRKVGQTARGTRASTAAAQSQQQLLVQGGTIKPDRPPTEYETRVYKVIELKDALHGG